MDTTSRSPKLSRAVDILCALIVLSGAGYFAGTRYWRETPGPAVNHPSAPRKISLDNFQHQEGISHEQGDRESSISLVEFGDYECAPCMATQPHLQSFLREHPEAHFVFFHLPIEHLHPHAVVAARAAEAAGLQGRFWEMHSMLFEKQDEWKQADNPENLFVLYATTLGLEPISFRSAMNSDTVLQRVKDSQQFGRNLGVVGTPTFYLNGMALDANIHLADERLREMQGLPSGRRYVMKPEYAPPPTSDRIPLGTRNDPFIGTGVIDFVDRDPKLPAIVISHELVPNFMKAMAMVVPVSDLDVLQGITKGMEVTVKFEILKDNEFRVFSVEPRRIH